MGGKTRNCYVCGRELKAHDVKIAMPSKAVGASGMSIDKRVLCSNCYYGLVHRTPAVQQGGLKKAIAARGRKLLIKEFRA